MAEDSSGHRQGTLESDFGVTSSIGVKMNRPGFGLRLLLEGIHHRAWLDALRRSSDPWLEEYGGDLILRYSRLNMQSSSADCRALGIETLGWINGWLSMTSGTAPAAFGGMVEFMADGSVRRTTYADLNVIEADDFANDPAEMVDAIGNPALDTLCARAEADQKFAQILGHFGKADNWIDLYKCVEALYASRGSEHSYLKHRSDSKRIKAMMRTANNHRHNGKAAPNSSVPFNEAWLLLRSLVREVCNEALS